MSTLEQLRRNLSSAWENFAEGWSHLRERAGQALTRFTPKRGGEVETVEDQLVGQSARWGLLATEVREDEDSVTVRLEVPGMERDDFDIDVIDDYLVVRGEKRLQREQTHGRYHVMECAYGSFERAVPLPVAVDQDGARAQYQHGVLTVTLPKHQRARSRRIDVQTD